MNIPQALIEVLDITLAGFQKENESFLISVFYKHEELLQIVNQNMLNDKSIQKSTFGLVLVICFDKKIDTEPLNRFEHSHFKFDSIKGENFEPDIVEYFLPLEIKSEKAAKTICKFLKKIFHIKSTKHLSFQFYEVE